jgi:hypothetical protein
VVFKFLKQRKADAVIAAVQEEVQRTVVAGWEYMHSPKDVNKRNDLLKQAADAEVSAHEAVRQLDFFHRLLAGLHGTMDGPTLDGLLNEAVKTPFVSTSPVQRLMAVGKKFVLETEGLSRLSERDGQGRLVYLRCGAEFRRKDGQLEVREDGITFTGEVRLEIPWDNVAHFAQSMETYQDLNYYVLSFQEGKRRTATKFTLPTYDNNAEYACSVVIRVWNERKKQT